MALKVAPFYLISLKMTYFSLLNTFNLQTLRMTMQHMQQGIV